MSMRKILASLRRADYEYNLIEDNDRIALGISGGKDSMMMLYALNLYQKFKHKNFQILAVFLDLGFPNTNTKPLEDFCEKEKIELIVHDSKDVYKILSQHIVRNNLLPCSICSRMKKAAINKVAKENNCNKVAFGHHADDAIETLIMNTIYGGRIATFSPKMYLSNADITFIRPLIYARESLIDAECQKLNLPIIKSPCQNDKKTQREEIKKITHNLYQTYPFAKENYLEMISNDENFDLFYDKKDFQLVNGYTIRKATTQQDYFDIINIRQKVFCNEQGISINDELDELDKVAVFYILRYKNQGVGTIRYVLDEKGYHLGRFCILKEHRGGGLGKKMFQFVENDIVSKVNPATIYFNAMAYLKDFYCSLGYKAISEPFTLCGIEHIEMEKVMTKKNP